MVKQPLKHKNVFMLSLDEGINTVQERAGDALLVFGHGA